MKKVLGLLCLLMGLSIFGVKGQNYNVQLSHGLASACNKVTYTATITKADNTNFSYPNPIDINISFSIFIGNSPADILCNDVAHIPIYSKIVQSTLSFYINTFGLFLIGAGLSPGFPVMLGLTGNIYKEISGTAFSFVMLIALTGNIVINYITGILIDQYGIGVFTYVIVTQILAMLALYLFIRKEDKSILHI